MRASGERVITGRFELVRHRGEGGMGVVWEAIEIASGEPRAIKLVRPDTTDSSAHLRFVREAEVLRGVAHPNVVKIFEIARDDDGAPAIVMELLRGESLAARIERETTLSVGQTCAILAKVTAAVAAAHAAGIIHRDLKPDNVFVIDDGRGDVDVRVLDFGVARKIESTPDKLTKTGTLVGTPYYMSPEQASGVKDLDGKTDVWSLAVITFECLTGKMPIRAENYGQLLMQIVLLKTLKIADVRPDLPRLLVDAIDGAFVERETRIDIGRLASVFAGFAEASIAPPPAAPAAATSAPTLLMASSTPHALESPTLIDTRGPPRAAPRIVPIAIASLVVVAIGGGAAITYRARSAKSVETTTTSSSASSISTASTASTASASASTVEPTVPSPPTSASGSGSPAASTVSSATISATSMAPAPTTATATAKKAPAKPAANGATTSQGATTAPTTTDRLQGGVGGNVPF